MSLTDWWLRRLAGYLVPSSDGGRQLLVDISVLHRHDAGTGIQRVVRAIWTQLASARIDGITVRPIFATGSRPYRYAFPDFLTRTPAERADGDGPIAINPGDIILGLDLAAHLLFRHQRQLAAWRRAGASLHVVVYDLLPLRHPEWFTQKTAGHFRRWLSVIASQADQVIAISADVARDVQQWSLKSVSRRRAPLDIVHFPLSGDLAASMPSQGISPEFTTMSDRWKTRDMVLMVGTVEPRKGHDVVLAAFRHLWDSKAETAPLLVIVGKPGWEADGIQQQIETLSATQEGLIWFRDLSDEALELLYARAALVIAASRGEGFGLPIAEALWRGRKVLARDLPVFRELAMPGLLFFTSDIPAQLATEIMNGIADSCVPKMSSPSWKECADFLLARLGLYRTETLTAA